MNLGFPRSEVQRLSECLTRLLPHIDQDEMALTGGVAIHAGMAATGRRGPRTSIADVDIVVSKLDAVAPNISDALLVSHYHGPQKSPKLLLQLVDPKSGMRVDVFPDLTGSLDRAEPRSIYGHAVKVLALADILEHKMVILSKASRASPVDSKHYSDARMLGVICTRSVANTPEYFLASDVYSTDVEIQCARCEASVDTRFPLAPKGKILEVLGYV